jgi:cytochrome c oxidase subunit III
MSGLAQPADRQLARTVPRQQVAATQFGVVVFLASDIMLFAPFFAAYFLLRENNPPWPPDGVDLDVARAALATAALVASSFTLVRFEHLGARGSSQARPWLLVTIALGAVFLGNQLAEYSTLDFGASDHTYGSIFWLLTGLHAAHVTVGLGALALLYVRATRARSYESMASWTNGISLFWHLVDVLWLFVFSTIWLLR